MAAAAVVATGGMAAVVEAAPGSPMVTAPAVAGAPAPTAPRTQSTLPEVSVHDIDPAQLAAVRSAGASGGGGQSVVQTIRLNVIGGELELVTDRATVVLQKVPGSKREWVGTLPAVRVIDARGTHAGWAVRWSVESIDLHGANGPGRVPAALVRLEPGAPVVVAGTSDGLASGKGGPSVRKGRTLFLAEPGSGGGTYEAGGSLSLRLPANLSPDQVTLVLSFSLG